VGLREVYTLGKGVVTIVIQSLYRYYIVYIVREGDEGRREDGRVSSEREVDVW
jgi:hypothetical protein